MDDQFGIRYGREMIPASVRRGSRSGRPAFTLLELLLVLGLVVVLAALAWPLLRGPMAASRLRDGASQVCAALAQARLAAMRAGTPCEFSYALSSGRLRYRCEVEDDPDSPAGSLPQGGSPVQLPPSQSDLDEESWTERELPEGVVFAPADTAQFEPGDASIDPPRAASAAMDWSPPITLYSDGTTADARIMLRNERGDRLQVVLRGLTGVARIEDVPQEAAR